MNSHPAEASRDTDAVLVSADVLAAKGEFEHALELYAEALTAEPDNAAAQRNMALVLGAVGRHEEAIEILTDLVDGAPHNLDARALLADCLRVVGDVAEAAGHYRHVLDADSFTLDVLRNFGICQLALGRTDAGRRTLQDVLTREPDDAEAYFQLGLSFYESEDHTPAIRHLEQAARLSDAPTIRASLAEALRQADRLDDALNSAELVVTQHPNYAHGWHTYGVIELQLRNFRRAADAFQRALELDPEDGLSTHNLGLCYRCMSDLDAALICFEDAERKLSPALAPKIERATTLLELERHREALPILEMLNRQLPEHTGVWNNLAIALMNLRRNDDALVACKQAIARNPEFVSANLTMVKCLIDLGHTSEGLRQLRAIMPRCEGNVHNQTIAAGFLETFKLEEEAIELYRQILERCPANQRAEARLFDLTLSICDWRDYDSRTAALIDRVAAQIETGEPITFDVFNLQALPVNYEFISKAAVNRARGIAEETQAKHPNASYTHARPVSGHGERIRLGYLLPYTHFHSLPLVLKEIVAHHDRDRFEVLGYCIQPCNGSEFSIR